MNTSTLTRTLPYAVKLAALSAMAFAVLKVALVANTLGLLRLSYLAASTCLYVRLAPCLCGGCMTCIKRLAS